ncbi:MAG: site-specific DNA-methyltransferase [Clostridia bacterium]|nr:site-specific DNA-methyltransferase [Clostridia bacterium]
MEIMDGMSLDLEQVNKEKLKSVFPECFSEDKLDIDKLLSLCGEYISNDFEKYKFEWKGKAESLQLAQRRSTGTLRPRKDESVNFDETENIYIKGDNLEVLKLLQTSYYRQVKMIYIDPPYNTGNDFVYEDDFADPLARYKEVTEQTTKSNPETMGRFHTNWLNMMYPRLRLAANLLRDDGVIFISIDDNEVTNLRKVCDEVFGEENFYTQIIVQSNKRGQTYKQISKTHEYMLVYTKHTETEFNELEKSDDNNDLNLLDKIGHFNIREIRNRNPKFGRHNRPNLFYPIYVNPNITDENGFCPVSLEKSDIFCIEVLPYNSQGQESCWRWGQNKLIDNNSDDTMTSNVVAKIKADGNYNIYEKYRKTTYKPKTIWDDVSVITEKGTVELGELGLSAYFDFPKPLELIKKTIQIGSNENDIILDFFSGSATTAHAIMQLNAEDGGNRKFICVQLPAVLDEDKAKDGYSTICDVGMERIRRAGRKIIEEQDTQLKLGEEEKRPLDIGFKVFELDTSNLKTWDGSPVDDQSQFEIIDRMNEMLDRVKADRSDLDMVYEIMLKTGIPLTYRIDEVDIQGKTAYSIGDDCLLLICLAENITPEIVDEMCDYAPAKLVLGKSSFNDATSMSNAHYICQDKDIELKLV